MDIGGGEWGLHWKVECGGGAKKLAELTVRICGFLLFEALADEIQFAMRLESRCWCSDTFGVGLQT